MTSEFFQQHIQKTGSHQHPWGLLEGRRAMRIAIMPEDKGRMLGQHAIEPGRHDWMRFGSISPAVQGNQLATRNVPPHRTTGQHAIPKAIAHGQIKQCGGNKIEDLVSAHTTGFLSSTVQPDSW